MINEAQLQWLSEIEKVCNAALLDVYDLSIANAPISPQYARETADCIGHRVGQIREAVAALRSNNQDSGNYNEADDYLQRSRVRGTNQ